MDFVFEYDREQLCCRADENVSGINEKEGIRKMTRKEVFEYCRKQYKTEPDYPWHDWNAVLRHSDSGKWYGLVMEIDRE